MQTSPILESYILPYEQLLKSNPLTQEGLIWQSVPLYFVEFLDLSHINLVSS